jgi:integrase
MPKKSETKLTASFVNELKPSPKGDVTEFFRDVPGLGVRVKPSGTKSYFFQYRDPFGRQRKMLIGPVWSAKRKDGLNPAQAIDKAIKMRTAVRSHEDPAAARDGKRNAKTVAQLCDEHLKAAAHHLKSNTLIMERSRVNRHVKPLLGSRPIASLERTDIEKFLADVAGGKSAPKLAKGEKRPRGGVMRGGVSQARRTVEMLAKILERAVQDGTIKTNPARKVTKQKPKRIKPPFSFDAMKKVGAAMRELEAEDEAAVGLRAIRHLLLSGFRRMEGLTLRWGMIDQSAHCARLPDTKTGPQIRPVGQPALDHLAAFKPERAKSGDFVFPGSGEAGHFVGLPKVWGRVAERAGIDGVSLHGLRHWFAGAAAEMNYSELVIAGLLGHTVHSVTARYATAPDSALVSAADAVCKRLSEALDKD